jgi:protein transport protein HofC
MYFIILILLIILFFTASIKPIVELVVQSLRSKQQGFLWMLAVSAERSVSLISAVESYAAEVGGFYGSRVAEFAEMLRAGVPVCDALGSVPLLIPRQLYPIIRTADESGAMAKGLREAASSRELQQDYWGSISSQMLYILSMICFGLMVLTFIMIKLIPSYEKIFKDFQTGLPTMTLALMEVSHWFVNYWYLFAPVFLGILFLFGYCLLKYFNVNLFDLPGVGRFVRRKHTAAILDNLAMSVEHGRPLISTLQTLSICYPQGSIQSRLRRTVADVQRGAAWGESLLKRDLIGQADLAVLQSAERAGNLAWAMRELADSNRRRLAYRSSALAQVLFPPVVICFGAMVLFIVLALFMPLISLIRALC